MLPDWYGLRRQAHFSKTLHLFFMPQIFNSLLSWPQLFDLVPCPRHRVPRNDFTPSTATFPNSPSKLSAMMVLRDRLLALVKLTLVDVPSQYGRDHGDDQFGNFECNFGRMNEKRFVKVLIGIQVAGSFLAFFVRYGLAWLVYDGDRR